MPKEEHLYRLIQSLSASEKRYFRLYCSSHGTDANYLRLFDAIDAQQVYDAQALKKQFAGERFIRQLHVTKNYLGRLILKSLRGFHSRMSVEARLKDSLRDIEILFSRELYEQCGVVIRQAEKLARRYEKLPSLLEILAWQRKLLLTQQPPDREALNQIYADETDCLSRLERQKEYWHYTVNIFEHLARGTETLEQLPLVADTAQADTMQSEVLYHHLWYTLHVQNGENAKALASLATLVERLEARPERIAEDPGSYVSALNNAISLMVWIKDYNRVPDYIKKIRSVPGRYKLKARARFTVKIWLRTYNIELEMYRDNRDFERCAQLMPEIRDFMEQHADAVPKGYQLSFWYQFANIFFMQKDFNNALVWINRILNTRFDRVREDLQMFARLLNLMTHFELGSIMVMRYFIDSSKRFLAKKKSIEPYEKIILRFFSAVSRAPEAEYPGLFAKLHRDLFQKDSTLVSAATLDYIDLRAWVESKLKPR